MLLAAAAWTSPAQSLEQQIDKLLQEKYPSDGPGATALVARGDQVIYHEAFGMANLELNVPMQIDMVFRIASISKQFTAVAILMLVEQGAINLDDDITQYLEDYPTEGQHISIRHLLTHTSGISRSITLQPWDANIRKHEFGLHEWIDYFKNEPKSFAPGTAFQYNNFGYNLLGRIISIVSGKSYEDFITTNIFEPLGMDQSRQAHEVALVPNRAYGYEQYADYVNQTYTSASRSVGAGSLMSTVEDLYRWNRGLVTQGLISQESRELAFTNHQLSDGKPTNYGFGWFINDINGSRSVEHAGGDHGFRADAIYLPEEEVFVAILSNCSCGEPRPLSTKIAALAIGKPFEAPVIVDTDENDIYPWVGKYTFEDGSSRRVTLKEAQLYWGFPNGMELPMSALDPYNFVLPNGMTWIGFQLEGDTLIRVQVKNRISLKTASKPYTKRQEITLPEKDLEKYVGRYQLFPNFDITIGIDQGQLTATGTDQEPSLIYPESPTRFFFKSLDSHIDFLLENGQPTALEITQDGATYSGTRVE